MIFQAAFLICSSPGADNELLTVFNSDAASSQCVCNVRLSPILLEGAILCSVNSVHFSWGQMTFKKYLWWAEMVSSLNCSTLALEVLPEDS